MVESSSVTFMANFPDIQSAIRVAGGGDGMRIQLDIPETEISKAVRLLMWREKRLKVTIEPDESEDSEGE